MIVYNRNKNIQKTLILSILEDNLENNRKYNILTLTPTFLCSNHSTPTSNYKAFNDFWKSYFYVKISNLSKTCPNYKDTIEKNRNRCYPISIRFSYISSVFSAIADLL